MVLFREDRCKGCGICVEFCPKKIIELSRDAYNARGFRTARCIDNSKCISCAFCAEMCPDCVITVTKE